MRSLLVRALLVSAEHAFFYSAQQRRCHARIAFGVPLSILEAVPVSCVGRRSRRQMASLFSFLLKPVDVMQLRWAGNREKCKNEKQNRRFLLIKQKQQQLTSRTRPFFLHSQQKPVRQHAGRILSPSCCYSISSATHTLLALPKYCTVYAISFGRAPCGAQSGPLPSFLHGA